MIGYDDLSLLENLDRIISIFIGTSLTMISFENSLGPCMATMVSNIIKCKCRSYDDHHMINGK